MPELSALVTAGVVGLGVGVGLVLGVASLRYVRRYLDGYDNNNRRGGNDQTHR